MSKQIFTQSDLAERWGLPLDHLRRRVRNLGLPAVNVGSVKSPDWRFRLSAIEEWEARNETSMATGSPSDQPSEPIQPGRPPDLAGYDPFAPTRVRRSPSRNKVNP
jgi:hypothetical protein